jgi:hypothetical protein
MFPAQYNNGYTIHQSPGYVVISYEMIHDSRIIPLDGRPHLGSKIRQWNGDPVDAGKATRWSSRRPTTTTRG